MSEQIGVVGLAVMGENLVLNLADHGVSLAVYNRTADRTRKFVEGAAAGRSVHPAYSLAELAGTCIWARTTRQNRGGNMVGWLPNCRRHRSPTRSQIPELPALLFYQVRLSYRARESSLVATCKNFSRFSFFFNDVMSVIKR